MGTATTFFQKAEFEPVISRTGTGNTNQWTATGGCNKQVQPRLPIMYLTFGEKFLEGLLI
jgi:hypothetical protein